MIKHAILLSFIILLAVSSRAQSSKLIPGKSFTNQSTDTLFVIPMDRVKLLLSSEVNNNINLQKLELYKKKISLFEERSALADSAITIKKLEADYWHEQLLQRNQLLENQQIENLKLIDDKNRIRQSRIYYLIGGLIAGAVVFSL